MKAVVFNGIGDISVNDVPDPQIQDPHDAVVKITASSICGTDLHLIRGTMTGMVPGTIIGHEGVGVIEQLGKEVRNFNEGDRVVIASSIGCGYCSYCRAGYFAQCDNANPKGKRMGNCYFGGPESSGPINGLQAEKARVPFANVGMLRIPDDVTDTQAISLSDSLPTGYFGADIAEIVPGDTVAVFGCGPVGLFAIKSAFLIGAGRVIAVDHIPSRLNMAREWGAETVNFEDEDPIQAILNLTGYIGVDRAIDAVGVDAEHPSRGPGAVEAEKMEEEFKHELKEISPQQAKGWNIGDAPSQAFYWEVESLAKAGTLSVVGVYPESVKFFPFGKAMNKNLTINMGNCSHKRYMPMLMDLIISGAVRPERIITNVEPLGSAVEAYKKFDKYQEGWLKVEFLPVS